MAKPKVTRTYGPIHFEDLDPHRFEDLVRELIYDYKDWQSIEATGRSGSDEGFDIRAYEKAETTSRSENENGEEVEEIHPMEGNLWMIQGKREKEIGPEKVKTILSEIDSKNPPYGYILAASANFSKKSYDTFREELRKKGVMEFYLWGKAELEDMLHLPKNDRILFTFFGVSLVSKRRSRTTEIRSIVAVKNKIYRTIGEGHQFHKSILIRDLKDTHYPYKNEYKDFDRKPRWKEYTAFDHHPLGLWCHVHKYYAYVDTEKKEWDFTRKVDLIYREVEDDKDRENQTKNRALVNDFWEFLPRANQGYFVIDGVVKYEDVTLVDDKGDVLYKVPHLYVDFVGNSGPFAVSWNTLEEEKKVIRLTDKFKRIKIFPSKIEKRKIGNVFEDKNITLDSESMRDFNNIQLDTLYELDGKYNFLNPGDVVGINDTNPQPEERLIQITHKFKTTIKEYLKQTQDFRIQRSIKLQLGRDYDDNEEISIYEFRRFYKWQLENEKKKNRCE
jgi:hypothetical protein